MFHKNHFTTLKSKPVYLKHVMCQISKIMSIFNFGTDLGLTGAKCLIKIIFEMKIEIE